MSEPEPYNGGEAEAIAFRIRAELVCCTIYGDTNDGKAADDQIELFNAFVQGGRYRRHDLCYWGEASARIAEDIGKGSRAARGRAHETRVKVALEAITRTLADDDEYLRLLHREHVATAVVEAIEDHDRRLMAAFELTQIDQDVDRAERAQATRPTDEHGNVDPGWGEKPSYQCWVYRHESCRRDDGEFGGDECTCSCHQEGQT